MVLGLEDLAFKRPSFRSWWWCCVCTDAVVAEQGGGVVVVRLVLLLPDSELLTGESLMLRRPLQKQTGCSQVHVTDDAAVYLELLLILDYNF